MESGFEQLRRVVQGGYCVGCGACAYAAGRGMQLNAYGEYQPDFLAGADAPAGLAGERVAAVCPSLNPDLDETALGERLFGSTGLPFDRHVGFCRAVYGGHVEEGDFRREGTSGGFGAWLGVELLNRGLIDGVIHVKARARMGAGDPFSGYALSRTAEEIRSGAKTRYHVAELSSVLEEIRRTPGRFLFIGVPCFAKAVRRLQLCDPALAGKIAYVASLVCGHMKTVHWSLSLAWAAGIAPDFCAALSYRTKGRGIPARKYVFRVESRDGSSIMRDAGTVVGGKFNLGALMVPACEFCDDLVGETADVSIGDAWLPRYEADPGGSNLLILRCADLDAVVLAARRAGRLALDDLAASDVASAQSGGFRQRGEGLAHRLRSKAAAGLWAPAKRIAAADRPLPLLRRWIYDARSEVTARSRRLFRKALEEGSFEGYRRGLRFLAWRTRSLEIAASLGRTFVHRLRRHLFALKAGVGGRRAGAAAH